jgi:tripartite-type tricarboxylate transporter receptor subunit TctC
MPAIAESGLPGYEAVSILGIFAAAKTPAALVARLQQEIARGINQPEIKEKFHASGVDIGGNTPEQFGALVKSEMVKWSKVFKEAGIRDE